MFLVYFYTSWFTEKTYKKKISTDDIYPKFPLKVRLKDLLSFIL